MSTFAFRAVDVAGIPSRGELDADSKGQVTEQLRERGLIVLDVSEKNEAFRFEQVLDRFRGIKARDMAIFSRQFATLIDSGMPMLRSLHTLEDQTEDERLRDAITGIRQDVEAGSSLADAMEQALPVLGRSGALNVLLAACSLTPTFGRSPTRRRRSSPCTRNPTSGPMGARR